MDHIHSSAFAEETLKATLNCYQIASVDSLSGPGGLPALVARMWYKQNKELPPIQQQPLVPLPYLIPNDKTATRSETMLAGEKIACFIVGGEKRLCLPQILTSVLREYSIAEINQGCAELHIYCSRCLPEQLEILKALGILPINTAQCGLITKTDAERLVALITDRHDPYRVERLPKDVDPYSGIPVYHECFGRGYGRLFPKIYVSPNSACILCKDCSYMYSPQRFIAHSDRSFEKRTCHWGFDPDNWRNYLLLPKDLDGPKREEYEKLLDLVKARFSGGKYEAASQQQNRSTTPPPTANKRRLDSEHDSPTLKKKIKEEDGKGYESGFLPHPYASIPYGVPAVMRHSAFRPWSPRSAAEMPVAQEIAHLKGLVPFALDRRGYPQYVHSATSSAVSTQDSEFALPPKPTTDSRHVATHGSASRHEERKKSVDQDSRPKPESPRAVPDRNNNRHDHHFDHGKTPVKLDQRSKSFEHPPLDRQSNLSRSSTRISSMPESSGRLPHLTSMPYVTTSEQQRSSKMSSNTLKEPAQEVSRPVSRSREAAASAMLELKSAGQYRSLPMSPTHHVRQAPSQPSHKVQTTHSASKFAGTIVPLDSSRQNYKWSIEGQSYIVSASGVQALEPIRSILETECSSESCRSNLMHEFIKMKSLSEEKIDIEMRVRRDLQIELDHLKASTNEKLQAAYEAKGLLKEEMENMSNVPTPPYRTDTQRTFRRPLSHRDEHSRRLEELKRRQSNFTKCDDSTTIKESRDLRCRIEELEMKNDKLRSCLLEEIEKREKAEAKLSEMDSTRGRMSFFMESPLPRMVRDVTRKNHDEDKTPAYVTSQNSRRSHPVQDFSSTPVSRNQRISTLPPPLIGPTSMNKSSKDSSRPSELESPNIVVVS